MTLAETVKTGDPDHAGIHNAERRHINIIIRSLGLVTPPPIPAGINVWDSEQLSTAPDASDAINQAMHEAAQRGGGTLRLPTNRYRLAATIQPERPDLVGLIGSGPRRTVLAPDEGVDAITIQPTATYAREMTWERFSVFGGRNGFRLIPSAPDHTLQAWGTFRDLEFLLQDEDGIRFDSPLYASHFVNVQCQRSGRYGMCFDSQSSTLLGQSIHQFDRCTFRECKQSGFFGKHLFHSQFNTPYFEANRRHAIIFEDCNYITVNQAYFEYNWMDGGPGEADILMRQGVGDYIPGIWNIYLNNPLPGPATPVQGEGEPFGRAKLFEVVATASGNVNYDGTTGGRNLKWANGTYHNDLHWVKARDGVLMTTQTEMNAMTTRLNTANAAIVGLAARVTALESL